MITVRKLRSLPLKTMLRKIITMLEEWERADTRGSGADILYRRQVFELLLQERSELVEPYHPAIRRICEQLSAGSEGISHCVRDLHSVRYGLMNSLGVVPADWDFYDESSGLMARSSENILPFALYLDDIRSPYNVGSIFRTAEAFGIEQIYLSRYTASPEHKRAVRTSMGCTDILPWTVCDLEELPKSQSVFALELGGTDIRDFKFPSSGIVVLGSEELGISPESRKIAMDSGGLVSIPLRGAKGSLNVAVAAGILISSWVSALTENHRTADGQ